MACILGCEMRRESSSKVRHQTFPDSEQPKRRQAGASVRSRPGLSVLWLLGCLLPGSVIADGLADDLGRNKIRVYASRFWVEPGRTITQLELPRRLERLGYERRRGERPRRPGEFFFGFEKFWFYRRPVRIGKKQYPARLIGLNLRRSDAMIIEKFEASRIFSELNRKGTP